MNSGKHYLCMKRTKLNIIAIIVFSVLLVVTICFILHNSMENRKASTARSDVIVEEITSIVKPAESVPLADIASFVRKSAHAIEFMLLGIEVYSLKILLDRKVFSQLSFAPIFFILFCGVIDEFVQSFTGRASKVSDVLIDFAGGLIGSLLVSGIFCLLIKLCKNKGKNLLADFEI